MTIASLLQSLRPVSRVAELGSFCPPVVREAQWLTLTNS